MIRKTNPFYTAFLGFALVAPVACTGSSDDGTSSSTSDSGTDTDTTTGPTTGTGTDTDTQGSGTMTGSTSGTGTGSTTGPVETNFIVTIENISGASSCPTPVSPGAWAIHDGTAGLFAVDAADADIGLEGIAEDGDPAAMMTSLAADTNFAWSGAFDTPMGAGAPAPAAPGESYQFTVTATTDSPNIEFATMFVQSNDIFLATQPGGIALFDGNGDPIAADTDVTDMLRMYDAGTENNQAPGHGPDQAPRQAAANTGGTEGGVFPMTDSTRALPLPGALADVAVTEAAGVYTITLTNVSDTGGMPTPLSPAFFATHDDTWSLFTAGSADAGDGLEALAEDGSPAALVTSYTGAAGIGLVGAAGAAPANPGQTIEIVVTPTAAAKNLTFATMVVQTNDVFLSLPAAGVPLLDDADAPRPVEDVEADIKRMAQLWDAGTEVNEVPGVGANQAPRQLLGNTGMADADGTVRRYVEPGNDLSGANLGGVATLVITNGNNAGEFDIDLTNTSANTRYPGALTPLVWATHDDATGLFNLGEAASAGLESLAEDGSGADLDAELTALVGNGVLANGIEGAAPLGPGDNYSFTVTPDTAHRFLSLATMVVPSNDSFAAFPTEGIALLDDQGNSRSDGDIATDVAAMWQAWNAGTEQNQAGAQGADQPPRQAGSNTGSDEGNGLVRELDDPVWVYPELGDTIRVTISPE